MNSLEALAKVIKFINENINAYSIRTAECRLLTDLSNEVCKFYFEESRNKSTDFMEETTVLPIKLHGVNHEVGFLLNYLNKDSALSANAYLGPKCKIMIAKTPPKRTKEQIERDIIITSEQLVNCIRAKILDYHFTQDKLINLTDELKNV